MRDVIVVGGGPAGSVSALLLARQGLDVLLLDRAKFPRDKPCGEFLTPAARPILEDIGVWSELRKAGLADVPAMRLHAPSGRVAEYRPFADEPAGYSVRRVVLDSILLGAARRAGVDVREGCAVRGLIYDGDRVSGVVADFASSSRSEIRGRLVIGADGTHSLVARSLGLVLPIRRLQRLAVVSHWGGLIGEGAIEMRAADGLVCGVGALGSGTANVTIVARTTEAARIAGRPGEYLVQAIGERFPDLAERMAAAECEPIVRTVGCFGHVTRRGGRHRATGVLLVGDAASFVDPFTGEGVYFALRGAEIAARVGGEALCGRYANAGAFGMDAAYNTARRELQQRYLLCGIVQGVVRSPILMERVVRRCGREPLTLARLMEVLGDIAPASLAMQPAFAARLFC